MPHVFPLEDCEARLAEDVGGKAVGLAALLRERLRVPPAFVVGASAYREFLSETGLDRAIHELLRGAESLEAQAESSRRIRLLFDEHRLGGALCAELKRAYDDLGGGGLPGLAVRSSAISEDAAEASFAGAHETYLSIHGADAVARAVARCWASLFTPQALSYFRRVSLRAEDTAMAVVVQAMVEADAAGVMGTIDPITGDPSQIAIEACSGLGFAVVGGGVTPDRYCVDKVTLEIRSRTLSAPASCLSGEEVVEVASLGKRIERALGAPQDIEWAIGRCAASAREVFLLQTRPETVWSRARRPPSRADGSTRLERIVQAMTRRSADRR